jgi:hypothetical protein
MGLDILAGLCLVGGAVFGSPSGTVHQLIRLVALILAAVGARLGLVPIAGFFYRMSGAEFQTAIGVTYLASFAVWFLVLWLATEELSNRVRDGQFRSTNDSYGGAAIGAIRGLTLAYIVAVGALTLQPSLASQGYKTEVGRFAGAVMERNFLSKPLIELVDRAEVREDEEHERSWDRATQ